MEEARFEEDFFYITQLRSLKDRDKLVWLAIRLLSRERNSYCANLDEVAEHLNYSREEVMSSVLRLSAPSPENDRAADFNHNRFDCEVQLAALRYEERTPWKDSQYADWVRKEREENGSGGESGTC